MEAVSWENQTNIASTGGDGTISSGGSGTNWDKGASSVQKYNNGLWMRLLIHATNLGKHTMVGIGGANVDANYTDIEWAWYLANDNLLYVYESANNVYSSGVTYAAGKRLEIKAYYLSILGNMQIDYIYDGIVRRSVTTAHPANSGAAIASKFPLCVDCSFYTAGNLLSQVQVEEVPLPTVSDVNSIMKAVEGQAGGVQMYVGHGSLIAAPTDFAAYPSGGGNAPPTVGQIWPRGA